MQTINLTRRAVSLFPPYLHEDEIKALPIEIRLIAAYAAKNPGLKFGNYCSGWNDKSGRAAYMADSRKITKQLQDVRDQIEEAWTVDVTSEDMQAAALHAFSGRLSFSKMPTKFVTLGSKRQVIDISEGFTIDIEYCTGQYWPMEYRAACAAVLEQAVSIARKRLV